MSNSTLTSSGTVTIGAVGATPPTGNGIVGQVYTNTTTGVTSVSSGTGWVNINTGAGSGGGSHFYTTGSTGPHYYGTGPTNSNADIYITTDGESIAVAQTLKELKKTNKLLMDRLCIIEPNLEKIEKYAALKKAYENYKMIESLIQEEFKDGK